MIKFSDLDLERRPQYGILVDLLLGVRWTKNDTSSREAIRQCLLEVLPPSIRFWQGGIEDTGRVGERIKVYYTSREEDGMLVCAAF